MKKRKWTKCFRILSHSLLYPVTASLRRYYPNQVQGSNKNFLSLTAPLAFYPSQSIIQVVLNYNRFFYKVYTPIGQAAVKKNSLIVFLIFHGNGKFLFENQKFTQSTF